ncbi:Putative toxin-antitoxin system, antitoxin component, HicB-like [Desulfonema limicola]|uniref:Toxin-antitoxin system, antitoxin component, HicB-like n=1 Tax=Desulfonema limicola TaxID=45656 RepID=A0A975GH18_9BACT|nr:toxin-antitoxin system HicB family antitoxin [Desulfonema limicola]QTA80819.1 Putative toxin-antitoxin system, antitoxin component, HicB-like [Desulfonema limicola]
MNKSLTLTLRMPVDLKKRLEREAKYQGVSLNQLTNYMITVQLTQLETVSALEKKLTGKSVPSLKKKVMSILDKIPERNVPVWDSLE